jgi:hypothetical protein
MYNGLGYEPCRLTNTMYIKEMRMSKRQVKNHNKGMADSHLLVVVLIPFGRLSS